LIQEEQGQFVLKPLGPLVLTPHLADAASRLQKQTTCQKLHTFPPQPLPKEQLVVSVLDLEQYRSTQSNRRMQPPSDPMHPLPGRTKRY